MFMVIAIIISLRQYYNVNFHKIGLKSQHQKSEKIIRG